MRRIIKIDDDKCDGCGLCALACHEGAIVMENGKARLISDSYCDGLGDCLGECPRGAISFETREAAPYDEAAVKARMAGKKPQKAETAEKLPCGCPGTMARSLGASAAEPAGMGKSWTGRASGQSSALCNWPVQLKLVPVQAPYLDRAELLLAADCTAFSCADFHNVFLPGKVCLIGCPKLDETAAYIEKIAQIVKLHKTPQIDVVYMEVPCCGGLVKLAEKAVSLSGEAVTLNLIKLSLEGKILEKKQIFPN